MTRSSKGAVTGENRPVGAFTVLVCGGRDFGDEGLLASVLDRVRRKFAPVAPSAFVVVHGGARGADRLAGRWADERGIASRSFPADWASNGKKAGPIRNQRMLELGRPDLVVAFAGGAGTADMIRRAEKANVPVIQVLA